LLLLIDIKVPEKKLAGEIIFAGIATRKRLVT